MNCLGFDRLLDLGEPDALGGDALAHANGCARCARALATARLLERALIAHFEASGLVAPAGFADRVLARVVATASPRYRLFVDDEALPWWTRVAAEPMVALASVVVGLLLWRGDVLVSSSRGLFPAATALSRAAVERAAAAGWLDALSQAFVPVASGSWLGTLGVAVALTPVLALAGWALWRAAEGLTTGALAVGRAR